jgi:Uma2 family endonuclease
MSEIAKREVTVDEFFEWQKDQERKYELVDGMPVLTVKEITGVSDRHDTVTINAIAALGSRLRGKPCFPRTGNRSVRTIRGTRRPDVLIECAKPDPLSLDAADPRVVIEVLSPSTTRYDRFRKLEEYKLNPAIRVILLVDTEAPRVMVWRRSADGWGYVDLAGLDPVIELPEIHAALPMAELYLDLAFETA